jgi:hypothetical protein
LEDVDYIVADSGACCFRESCEAVQAWLSKDRFLRFEIAVIQDVGNFLMLQEVLEYPLFFEAGEVQNVLSDGNSNSQTRLPYSQYRIIQRLPLDRDLTEPCVLKIQNGMFVMGKGDSGRMLLLELLINDLIAILQWTGTLYL